MKRALLSLLVFVVFSSAGCGSATWPEQKTYSERENAHVISSSEDTTSDTSEVLEITFLNYSPSFWREMMSIQYNILESAYEEDDENRLYAFIVEFDHYFDGEYLNQGMTPRPSDYPKREDYESIEEYESECSRYETRKAVELMKKEGLIVLPDYPYCCYNQDNCKLDYGGDLSTCVMGLCAVAGTMKDIRRVFDKTESMEGWYCYATSALRPDVVEKAKEAGWTGNVIISNWREGDKGFYWEEYLGTENQVTLPVKIR